MSPLSVACTQLVVCAKVCASRTALLHWFLWLDRLSLCSLWFSMQFHFEPNATASDASYLASLPDISTIPKPPGAKTLEVWLQLQRACRA